MANLRTAMDSMFYGQPISSPQTLEGSAHSIPGDPFPLDGSRASKALRIQQLSLLGNGFPLGIIPSYSPSSDKELGSFSLQSNFFKFAFSNFWVGLVGQFRPRKLITSIKGEFENAEELDFHVLKDAAKHVLDKSLYSMGISSQFSFDSTSVLLSTERHGEKDKPRYKMMLAHQFPQHDITLEAGWPELFIDHKGKYWNVPESITLDMSSIVSDSGFRYRFGIHKSSGHPEAVNAENDEPPSALMPGICGKAAFSLKKKKDFWRQKETREETLVKTDKGTFWHPSYDVRLNEPHAAISALIGGTVAAWFRGGDDSRTDGNISAGITKRRSPVNADLFGSVCYTYQHGKFRKLYGDLSRVDARLDVCSASSLAKRVFNVFSSSAGREDDPLSSPKLNFILQQQIAGPIVFRVDSRFSLGSPAKPGPQVEDVIYSLNYSLRLLSSGKVVAWYSRKRREGMIELRLFEF